jgi:hypothetical protein
MEKNKNTRHSNYPDTTPNRCESVWLCGGVCGCGCGCVSRMCACMYWDNLIIIAGILFMSTGIHQKKLIVKSVVQIFNRYSPFPYILILLLNHFQIELFDEILGNQDNLHTPSRKVTRLPPIIQPLKLVLKILTKWIHLYTFMYIYIYIYIYIKYLSRASFWSTRIVAYIELYSKPQN